MISFKDLFFQLYNCSCETDVTKLLEKTELLSSPVNWFAFNQNCTQVSNDSNKNAILALSHLINESITSVLIKDCNLNGFALKNLESRSNEELKLLLYPHSISWNSFADIQKQPCSIDIFADGERLNTSLVIIDQGIYLLKPTLEESPLAYAHDHIRSSLIALHPHAINYCGNQHYILKGSTDVKTNTFYFTLIRRCKVKGTKNMCSNNYELFQINKSFPRFEMNSKDIKLAKNDFKYGNVIKLYNYELPKGSRSVISGSLLSSVQEYLFDPIIPIFYTDQSKRYTFDRFIKKVSWGQLFKLQKYHSTYIDHVFNKEIKDPIVGTLDLTIYVFKTRVKNKHEQTSKGAIKQAFFKNEMSTIFVKRGLVNRYIENDFISDKLNFKHLKHHLLIVISCDKMRNKFQESFLKNNEYNGQILLESLIKKVLKDSELVELDSGRK